MARAKFQTLTEQMFYILLCLRQECCGMDIMERVREMTEGRWNVDRGNEIDLWDRICKAKIIEKKKEGGRRKRYTHTEGGKDALGAE